MITLITYITIFTELLCIGFFSLYKYQYYHHKRKEDFRNFVIMIFLAFAFLISGISYFEFKITSELNFKHVVNIGLVFYLAYLFFSQTINEIKLKNQRC